MCPLLLKAFVTERLNAAAEEICQVFERTIAKYEEEASISKQEIERLRGLLLERRTDISQFSVCEDERPGEQLHCKKELSIDVQCEDPEPRRIKEEDNELWATEQEEEKKAGEGSDVSCPPHSSVWEDNKQENTKPPLQPQSPTSEPKDEFQETQETKTVQFTSPPALTPSSQSETVKDAGEPAAHFTSDRTQTEQRQTSFIFHTESTELSDLNFSSHQLTNHAFCVHSKDPDILCAVCGRTFESTENLDTHLKTHKSSNCCNMCGKHCNSKTALTEHVAGHAGVKLHRCHVCGKECSRKGDLKIHLRIHTGEKPFCCSLCCKSFTHSGHLRKHMRSHTGERPHRCDICGRGFLQSTHLKYHLGTHTQKY